MAKYVDRLPLRSPGDLADLYARAFRRDPRCPRSTRGSTGFRHQHASAGSLRSIVGGQRAAGRDAQEQLSGAAAAVRPRATSAKSPTARWVWTTSMAGWRSAVHDGRELRVRAFGARTLHIPAGNGGLVSAVTILRSVITRSDIIIKAPSNDPLTAVAIARTLADVAPDHPITKHLVVGYWKGGDTAVEETALPAPEHRKDRRLGRFGLGQARHPVHPAGPGADRAGPQAQRHHHRRRKPSPTTTRPARSPSGPRWTSAWPTRRAAPTPG